MKNKARLKTCHRLKETPDTFDIRLNVVYLKVLVEGKKHRLGLSQ